VEKEMTYQESIEVRLARLEEKEAAAQMAVAKELAAIHKILAKGHTCYQVDRLARIESNLSWTMKIGAGVLTFLLWLDQQTIVQSFKQLFK
jgi:hypothetical protein